MKDLTEYQNQMFNLIVKYNWQCFVTISYPFIISDELASKHLNLIQRYLGKYITTKPVCYFGIVKRKRITSHIHILLTGKNADFREFLALTGNDRYEKEWKKKHKTEYDEYNLSCKFPFYYKYNVKIKPIIEDDYRFNIINYLIKKNMTRFYDSLTGKFDFRFDNFVHTNIKSLNKYCMNT